jgi:hypothetical protein
MTVQVIAICIGFSIFANLATDFMLKEKRKRIEVLEQHQGSFLDLTVEDIQEATTTVADKKGAYDDIRVKSDMTYYLVQIPQLLPSSAWLKGLQINYSEAEVTDKKAASSKKKGYVRKTTKIEVRFNGQVYHEDKASQIQIANGIVPELKKDPYFSKVFESIKLLSVNTSVTNDVEVTEFNVEMR